MRLILGLGTSANSLEIKSSGSKMTWVAPAKQGDGLRVAQEEPAVCRSARTVLPGGGSAHIVFDRCTSVTGVYWIQQAL